MHNYFNSYTMLGREIPYHHLLLKEICIHSPQSTHSLQP